MTSVCIMKSGTCYTTYKKKKAGTFQDIILIVSIRCTQYNVRNDSMMWAASEECVKATGAHLRMNKIKLNMSQNCLYNLLQTSYQTSSKLVTHDDLQVQLCTTPTSLSTQSNDRRRWFNGGMNTNSYVSLPQRQKKPGVIHGLNRARVNYFRATQNIVACTSEKKRGERQLDALGAGIHKLCKQIETKTKTYFLEKTRCVALQCCPTNRGTTGMLQCGHLGKQVDVETACMLG